MSVSIDKFKNIPDELKVQLKMQGFLNSDQLLEATRTPTGRKTVAKKLGVDSNTILGVANRADLARVRGVGGVFSDLLEHAGVDTVKELAIRRPENLYAKLVEINAEKNLAGRAPTQNAVEDWVAQAKDLPRKLEY
jgi:predicted flap endonuclease-1-like 5' DNA nuclease